MYITREKLEQLMPWLKAITAILTIAKLFLIWKLYLCACKYLES